MSHRKSPSFTGKFFLRPVMTFIRQTLERYVRGNIKRGDATAEVSKFL